MATTDIEWTTTRHADGTITKGSTWNPVVGCTRASAGCDNCYAVTMTKRLEAMGQSKYAGLVNIGKNHFNGVVRTVEDALAIPLRWTKPRKVFVNSMSDLFHPLVPFWFIDKVFAVMALTPQHTYQVLTKRPERMAEYFSARERYCAIWDAICEMVHAEDRLPARERSVHKTVEFLGGMEAVSISFGLCPNWVWLGTSVEDQAAADERIPYLLKCPAAVRFLSCEPLLGPVDLREHISPVVLKGGLMGELAMTREIMKDALLPTIDWVICGGESGPKARPMHPDWARSLRDQCVAAGVPFFFKQWGEFIPEREGFGIITEQSAETALFLEPDGTTRSAKHGAHGQAHTIHRVGKHRAGRMLDGREWNEYPEAPK